MPLCNFSLLLLVSLCLLLFKSGAHRVDIVMIGLESASVTCRTRQTRLLLRLQAPQTRALRPPQRRPQSYYPSALHEVRLRYPTPHRTNRRRSFRPVSERFHQPLSSQDIS